MTDYYPLIDTAVAALENNTSAARRTVYEYARSALVRQSRNKIPPLTEAELAGERLALEQAILRVAGGAGSPQQQGRVPRPFLGCAAPGTNSRAGPALPCGAPKTDSGASIAAKPIVREARGTGAP